MKKIIIKKAEKSDFEGIYSLLLELEYPIIPGKKAAKAVYEKNIAGPLNAYYTAVYNGNITGFISVHIQNLFHHAGKVAEVQELIIKDNLRGKGIGNMLLDKCEKFAVKNKCVLMEVCCNKKRKMAHKFYKANNMKNSHYKFIRYLN